MCSSLDRFFGAHDRSLVPLERCVWLSRDHPATFKNHQTNMVRSLAELRLHVQRLEERFGPFRYAAPMTPVDVQRPHLFLATLAGKFFSFV